MKTTLYCHLLIVSLLLFSFPNHTQAKPLKDLESIHFGMNHLSIKKTFPKKHRRANLDPRSTENILVFTGGSHLKKPVSRWVFKLNNATGLHTAIVAYKPSPSYLVPYYSYLKIVLNKTYGPSKKPVEVLQPPYKPGQEIEAIKAGKGKFLTFWKLKENKSILLTLTNQSTINLVYQDTKLQLAAKKQAPQQPTLKTTLTAARPEKYSTIIKLIQSFNDPEKALTSVNLLIKQYPNYPEAYVIKAAILFEQQKYQDTINLLTISASKASTTKGVQAESHWLKGKAYSKLFQCNFAQNHFKSACEMGHSQACQTSCP